MLHKPFLDMMTKSDEFCRALANSGTCSSVYPSRELTYPLNPVLSLSKTDSLPVCSPLCLYVRRFLLLYCHQLLNCYCRC